MESCRLSLAMVVPAAGYGVRLDSGLPKQYVPILGIPMLQHTLMALDCCPRVDAVLVVVHPEDVEYCLQQAVARRLNKVVGVTAGGETRALSVRNGLRAVVETGTWDLIGVHDGSRPLVTSAEIVRAVETLEADPELDGVILATPSIDTIKLVDEGGLVLQTLDRRTVWQAQTPQIFRAQVLLEAYSAPEEVLCAATDDSFLVERLGGRVAVVEGSRENFKVTDRVDLRHAERILTERQE